MTLEQFVATESGQDLDYDGIPADTGQCVQLVSYYLKNVLNVPVFIGNAVDWWNDFNGSVLQPNFTKIPYSQANLPTIGDVVVFGASETINSPLYGHVDVCISVGAPSGYTGFDSNWGGEYNNQGYPIAHQVQHSYNDVLGYLRPEIQAMTPAVATELALYIRLLAFESVADADANSAYDVEHIVADPSYAAVLAKQLYSTEWQVPAYKASHYDADLAAAKAETLNKASVEAYISENLS